MAEEEYGYISLSRKICDMDFFLDQREYSLFEAWLYLLMDAAWKDHKRIRGMTPYIQKRGDVVVTQRKLAEDWGWSQSKVSRFLHLLQSQHRVCLKSESGIFVITITNYDRYQNQDCLRESRMNQERIKNESRMNQYQNKVIREINNCARTREECVPDVSQDLDDYREAESIDQMSLSASPEYHGVLDIWRQERKNAKLSPTIDANTKEGARILAGMLKRLEIDVKSIAEGIRAGISDPDWKKYGLRGMANNFVRILDSKKKTEEPKGQSAGARLKTVAWQEGTCDRCGATVMAQDATQRKCSVLRCEGTVFFKGMR